MYGQIRDLDASITSAEKRLREMRLRVPSGRQLEARRLAALKTNKALQNRIQQVCSVWPDSEPTHDIKINVWRLYCEIIQGAISQVFLSYNG